MGRSPESYERQKAAKRIEYHWYAKHGICVSCHQAAAVPGMKNCGDCLYKKQLRHIRNAEKERPKFREHAAKFRSEHKALGLCVECSQPAIEGTTRCKRHTLLHRIHDAMRRVRKVPDENVCSIAACNALVVPGKRFCEYHYRKKCATAFANQPKGNSHHIWRRLDHARVLQIRSEYAKGSADKVKGAGS